MPLAAGSRLGPYEILASAGAGGMGEVYRARDTRLDRIVAVKVLPADFAADPQFRDRFDREARAISALDHPHICALYDVGEQDSTAYLVMQYLEGETLADRLSAGALPVEQAIPIAIQVADALAAAHKTGIVHRDLKPGNIMLTKAGAKLLDFGLAKAAVSGVAGAHLSMAPTTPPLTQMGAILGTVQYMAPEQIEGQEADARADIFAFGAVVYEMLTGKKAFAGKSQASVMAAILNLDPPPMLPLVPLAPPILDHIVTRCLAKDPDERWQTARDVLHELRWASENRSMAAPAVAGAPRRSLVQRAAWPIAFVFAIAAMTIGGVHWFGAQPVPRTTRFEVFPPKDIKFATGTAGARQAISPDGRLLAFASSAGVGKANQIWVRKLDGLEATLLSGTDGVDTLFWSPDSRFIGFFADQKLKRSDVTGGLPLTLCSAPGQVSSGTWNADGVILFSSLSTGGIRRVSSEGGEPTQVTVAPEGEGRHAWPRFLPDGHHFLFFTSDASGKHGTFVGSLDSSATKPLMKSDSVAEAAAPDTLVYVRETALVRQSFDPGTLKMRGDAVRIVDNVSVDRNNGRAGFSVSRNGVLVFAPGSGVSAGADLELRVFDRSGREVGRTGGAWAYRGVDLSPDGRRVAVHRHEDQGGDIWVVDLDTGSPSRLTFDPLQHNVSPVWSPDGAYIAFGSRRNGAWGLYRKSAAGVGAEELLFASKSQILPMDWSRDGQTLVFWLNDPKTSTDIWRLPLGGDRRPVPVLQTPAIEQHAQLSPDGRWMTYTSTESGRAEVYVQSFPMTGTKYQITTEGALFPRWRHDGKEILFMQAMGPGRVTSVSVQPSGQGLKFSSPKLLFESGYVNFAHGETGGGMYHTFAVTADGQRLVTPVQRTSSVDASVPLVVVLNWMSTLPR